MYNNDLRKGVIMKKVNITITFDDDKLDALEFSLRKEHSSVQARMDDAPRYSRTASGTVCS